MRLRYLQKPTESWNEKLPTSKKYPRHWITTVDIEVTLSNGFVLKKPKGTIWDGASVPKFLWWLFKPIDEGAIGDFIHDSLWTDKKTQLELFHYNIYQARLFADNERLRWRTALAPKKRIKNTITYQFIRKIGGLFYSRELEIPT